MAAPIRQKHLGRYREIAGVLADEGFGYLLDELGLSRFLRPGEKEKRHAPGLQPTLEERLRRTMERLGPTFVKLGQILSTRPDILPENYLVELRKLQDEVRPVPYETVREIIDEELGGRPEEVFAFFDPVPLAAASIGQVHAARLLSGEEVVVKVQRPDVRHLIETDLDILLTQAQFVERNTAWGRDVQVISYAEELSRILKGELDYLAEGRNAERFADNFAGTPEVHFPCVYWEWSTQRVLTLERFRGIKLDEIEALEAGGYDRVELARRGVNAYFKMVFLDGFYHADPHPGNIFALQDGTIAFTDFGRVGIITEVMGDALSDLLIALIDRDETETLDVLYDMGVASRRTDDRTLRADLSRMFAHYYDTSIDQLRASEVIGNIMKAVRTHGLRLPPEYALALATFIVLEGVGLQLDPKFNLVRAAQPFTRRVIREKMAPNVLTRNALRAVRRASRLLVDVPDSLSRVMRRAADGSLVIEVKPTGLEPILDRLAELVNRVAFAVLVSSFVIGLSFLLRQAKLPTWLLAISGLVLVASFGVGVWLFVSIFISIWSAQRHRRH